MWRRALILPCTVPVRVKRLPHAGDLPLPVYKSEGAAGFDLSAAIPEGLRFNLGVGQRVTIPTGFAFEIPGGYQLEIRSRSGLGTNDGIIITNAPGTIDADYRGEVFMSVLYVSNTILAENPEHVPGHSLYSPMRAVGAPPFSIQRGDRLAQAVLMPVFQAGLQEIGPDEELSSTVRGTGGLGSTGAR